LNNQFEQSNYLPPKDSARGERFPASLGLSAAIREAAAANSK